MQENPFGHLLPQQQAPQQPPRRIMGAPATIDPGQAANIGIARQRLALDQEKADRERNELALTPAQEAVDKEFAKEYVAWNVAGGFSDFEKQTSQLKDSLGALDTSDSITGPVVGRLGDFVNSYINPEAISTREDVEEVVQRNLRLILGAQFTEKEGERLIARAYNPRLEEAENKKRVSRLLKQMQRAAAQKRDAVKYYEENGTLAGWSGSLPSWSDFDPENDTSPSKSKANPEDDALIRKYLD